MTPPSIENKCASAVIVAAGKGTRMGPNIDKLFIEIAGRPLVAHTWQRFDDSVEIEDIILVIREGMESHFRAMSEKFNLKKPFRFALGGKERQDSVYHGLQALRPECELVAIQDGARPCTSGSIISATLAAARQTGAAVAAQKVTDTLKEADGTGCISRNIDRSKLWAVQTPQAFRKEIILRALESVIRQNLSVTDDTAACELIGQPVRLIESATPNPKATSPSDLAFIEMLLTTNQTSTIFP